MPHLKLPCAWNFILGNQKAKVPSGPWHHLADKTHLSDAESSGSGSALGAQTRPD